MKIKKFVVVALVLLTFLFAPLCIDSRVFAEGAINFAVSSAEAAPGEEVELVISITENSGFVGGIVQFTVDPNVAEVVSAKQHANYGFPDRANIATPDKTNLEGVVRFMYFTAYENEDGSPYEYQGLGEQFTIVLKIKADAAGGEYTLTLDDADDEFLDYDLNGVPVTFTQGTLTVKAPTTEEITETEVIPFDEEQATIEEDPNEYEDYKEVITPGQNGEKKVTYKVYYDANGNEVNREPISEEVIKEPVPPVIKIGTKPIKTYEEVEETKEMPFEEVRNENPELTPADGDVIVTSGKNGVSKVIIKQTFIKGIHDPELDEIISEEVIEAPINQVIEFGYKYQLTMLAELNPETTAVEVELGTPVEDVLAKLPQTVQIEDKYSNSAEATITWSINAFDAAVAGTYEATGTVELPEGWTLQEGIEMVTTQGSVKVINLPFVVTSDNIGDEPINIRADEPGDKLAILPEMVTVYDDHGNEVEVKVTWNTENLDVEKAGAYVLEGTADLPEGWTFAENYQMTLNVVVLAGDSQPEESTSEGSGDCNDCIGGFEFVRDESDPSTMPLVVGKQANAAKLPRTENLVEGKVSIAGAAKTGAQADESTSTSKVGQDSQEVDGAPGIAPVTPVSPAEQAILLPRTGSVASGPVSVLATMALLAVGILIKIKLK